MKFIPPQGKAKIEFKSAPNLLEVMYGIVYNGKIVAIFPLKENALEYLDGIFPNGPGYDDGYYVEIAVGLKSMEVTKWKRFVDLV